MDTRTPYLLVYPGKHGGKTAQYMLRWVTTTGEEGPWAETASGDHRGLVEQGEAASGRPGLSSLHWAQSAQCPEGRLDNLMLAPTCSVGQQT